MLPPKAHEANPTEVFQAVVQQNVRKWQALGRRAEKYGPATIREAQIAVSEVLNRLDVNTAVFNDWYEARRLSWLNHIFFEELAFRQTRWHANHDNDNKITCLSISNSSNQLFAFPY